MYKGVYGSVEEDLLQIGKFNSIKMGVMRMPLHQRIDIYYGVYKVYIKPASGKKEIKTKHLFSSLFDWFKLDFSVKTVENLLNDPVMKDVIINSRR